MTLACHLLHICSLRATKCELSQHIAKSGPIRLLFWNHDIAQQIFVVLAKNSISRRVPYSFRRFPWQFHMISASMAYWNWILILFTVPFGLSHSPFCMRSADWGGEASLGWNRTFLLRGPTKGYREAYHPKHLLYSSKEIPVDSILANKLSCCVEAAIVASFRWVLREFVA